MKEKLNQNDRFLNFKQVTGQTFIVLRHENMGMLVPRHQTQKQHKRKIENTKRSIKFPEKQFLKIAFHCCIFCGALVMDLCLTPQGS